MVLETEWRPNSTCLVTSRHDSTRYTWRVCCV